MSISESSCVNVVCSNGEDHRDALRGDMEYSSSSGLNSVRQQIALAGNSAAKKWSINTNYGFGDLCSLNDNVFISLKHNNIRNNPLQRRDQWINFLQPYFKNQGKIKGYFVWSKETGIIKSYNVTSISENNGEMTVSFTTPISPRPICSFGLPEHADSGLLSINQETVTSNYIQFEVVKTVGNTDITQFYPVGQEMIVTCIVFGSSSTIPA